MRVLLFGNEVVQVSTEWPKETLKGLLELALSLSLSSYQEHALFRALILSAGYVYFSLEPLSRKLSLAELSRMSQKV